MKFSRTAFVLFAGLAAAAMAADAPVAWVLEFKHVPPKRVVIEDPAEGKVPYWYIGYSVTNPYDDPKMLLPEFEIITKAGKRYTDTLYPEAQKLAEIRDGKDYLDCIEMRGVIQPGETKFGIAIFKQIHRDTNTFSVFVDGLSAIQVQEINGDTARATVKIFQADYYWPGDRYHFDPENFELTDTQWIVREKQIKLGVTVVE